MIRISVKGLAKFMTSRDRARRKVLRDFKYPDDDEAHAQAAYYAEARSLISKYHAGNKDPRWLLVQAMRLGVRASTSDGQKGTRLRHNSRALKAYASHFAGRHFEVLDPVKWQLCIGGVHINVVPDLHVAENGTEKVIKFDFSVTPPDAEVVQIVSQVIYEAAEQAGFPVSRGRVLYLDVPRGQEHKGARPGARKASEIQAACENIEALWDGIKR